MKVKTSLIILGVLLLQAVSPVLAVDSTTGSSDTDRQLIIQQKKQLIAEKKEKFATTKCASIESKIQARITRFDDGKVRRLSAFNNMKTRLTALETKLATKGYDTTKLKADLLTLSTKIDKFSSDYATYISGLGLTDNYACGKSEGEFRAQLLESRDLLATVLADSKYIRDYYTGTIKPDLQAIKKQTPTINQTGDTASNQ